ncbi:hypothetical protein [Actinomadura violacea]|uniref:Uncharacterized protein n=1 Tax=Actinomadura violacea TaxID=2819934 RepID=A0ABS3S872_9ACTN|nr:hypothetical protein [Actinomadura violacea]MBO2464958.1 hypothetical protein [Actinomadura violacea]
MEESISRRRGRDTTPRPHRVGPVRFSDQEFTWVTIAAQRAGQARSAYVAAAAAAVARGEVSPHARNEHETLRQLMSLRSELQHLALRVDQALAQAPTGNLTGNPTGLSGDPHGEPASCTAHTQLSGTLADLDQTVHRLDEAISALLPYRTGQ